MIDYGGKRPKLGKGTFVVDTATLVGDVSLGRNCSVWYGAVLRGDMHYIKVGDNVSIQDNAVLHGTIDKFPTVIGNNVSIGHGAIVHGCRIGNNCLIGMGSIILEGAVIGDWCIIAAGAVVTEGSRIPDKSIVMGIPGKVKGKITKEHAKRISNNWKEYSDLAKKYLK